MDKQLAGAPHEILKRYEKWKDIAMISGPVGPRRIKGLQENQGTTRRISVWRVERTSFVSTWVAIPDNLPNLTCTAAISDRVNYRARLSEAIEYEGVSSGKKAH